MSKTSWAIVIVGMVGATAALGGYKYLQISSAIAAAQSMPEPQEMVEVVKPRLGTWSASARAVGSVSALRHVELRNELAGTVAEVGFTSGAVVEAGQVLVRLDTSEEAADLAAARAEAELARLTLERRQRLAKSPASSEAELDQARADLAAKRARVAGLEAKIAKKTLTAPFKARVGIVDLQPGAFLDAGMAITTLQGVDPDAYVDFSFPQDQAAVLAPGAMVTVQGPGLPGGRAEAKIVARDASVENASRSARFRAVLSGLGDALPPGAFVDVVATTGAPRPAMFIPLTAVRRAPYGDHVYTVVQDGQVQRAKQAFVQLGPVQGEEVVVLGGLEAQQPIAAKGSFKLREGLAIIPGGAAEQAAAAPAASR